MGNRLTLTPDGIRLAALMVHNWTIYERLPLIALSYGPPDDQAPAGFRLLSQRTAAEWLPFDARHAHVGLRTLVAQGVLEHRPGLGSRASSYRPEGDVRRWLVEWGARGKRDPDHVQRMLEDEGVVIVAPQLPGSRRGIARQKGLVVTRHTASQPELVTRHTASQADEYRRAVARHGGSSSSSDSTGQDRRPSAREVEEEAWSSLGDDEARSTWLRLVIDRITQRGTGTVQGSLVRRLAAIACAIPLAEAEKIIASQPDSQRSPAVVHALEVHARSGPTPARAPARRPVLAVHDPETNKSWRETFDDPEAADAAAERYSTEGLDVVRL